MVRRALAGALAGAVFVATSAVAAPLPPHDLQIFQQSLEASAEAVETYGRLDRPEIFAHIAEIGYRVARESHFDRFPISFYLIDMVEPNAFSLPGGQVFVSRGMLDLELDDDEWAALLGHEIGHVVFEHGLKLDRRATLLNVLSQALLVGVLIAAQRGGNRAADPRDPYAYDNRAAASGDLIYGTYAASAILGQLLLLSNSREFEDQADEEGQRMASSAGFRADGTVRLMNQLAKRLPEDREYGYWRTHPFFEDRVRAAKARALTLATGEPHEDEAFRIASQEQLLAYADGVRSALQKKDAKRPPEQQPRHPKEPGAEPGRDAKKTPRVQPVQLVEEAALAAWPKGLIAERLRRERLDRLAKVELAHPAIARDYGKVLSAYDREIGEVRAVTPDSGFLVALQNERDHLATESRDLYPQAKTVIESGVFETSFLETFLSNYPEAPERPRAALALGEAYSRTGRQADAVTQFLAARRVDPTGPTGKSAAQGLKVLAPHLDQLAALGELSAQTEDSDLAALARQRLASQAPVFSELANGAGYLKRFPDGESAAEVTKRLNVLADNLYGEVILYQGIGDHVKALERIEKILSYAPLSPAATKLLDKAIVPSEAAG